jgi:biopolymer transport protein ExbD
MTKVENIVVNVPSATQVEKEFGADIFHIAVDEAGKSWVEKKAVALPDLYTVLSNRFKQNPKLAVYIGGDSGTRHGDMVAVLEIVRRAGIQKIAFTVSEQHIPVAPQAGT